MNKMIAARSLATSFNAQRIADQRHDNGKRPTSVVLRG